MKCQKFHDLKESCICWLIFVAEYQDTFNIFDNRGDQKVYVWQIGEILRACGQNPTEAEWKKYMGEDQGNNELSSKSHFLLLQQSLSFCFDSAGIFSNEKNALVHNGFMTCWINT